ncbi:putative RNA pseudouridine synthase [Phycisphaerales bacterium]|nr:putative RNA pseudouridine synthase [Phycisphaerales bacterium]
MWITRRARPRRARPVRDAGPGDGSKMANLTIQPNDRITFKVRYEDEDVLVVVKPAGVVTVPGLGHEDDSLLNGLFARAGAKLQNIGKSRDFGLLHRLDRETSGLVIAALSVRSYDALRAAFEKREVEKYYWAVVRQAPKRSKGVIRGSLLEYEGRAGDDPRKKKLARVASNGKPALTAYRVLSASANAAVVECRTITGRLHQVRVHLESIGCPILGDDLYGPRAVREAAPRLALHAHRIAFSHPRTGARVDVRAAWPADLRGLLKRFRLPRPDADEFEGRGPPPAASDSGIERGHEVNDDAVGDEDA